MADAEYGDHVEGVAGYCDVCGQDFRSKDSLDQHIIYEARNDLVGGHALDTSCKVCGESFVSPHNLEVHMGYAHTAEERKNIEEVDQEDWQKKISPINHFDKLKAIHEERNEKKETKDGNESVQVKEGDVSRALLANWMGKTKSEIVCIVEGCEDVMGGSVQARHSYSFNCGDVVFDASFAPCLRLDKEEGCVVDFSKFHDLVYESKPVDHEIVIDAWSHQ
jgi:hypothetical protein